MKQKMKICGKCFEEKPLTDFYYRWSRRRKDGSVDMNYYSPCIQCRNVQRQRYRKEIREKKHQKRLLQGITRTLREHREFMKTKRKSKICPSCKKRKFLDLFSTRKKSPDGKQTYCRSCYNKKMREYYTINSDKKRESNLRKTHNITLQDYAVLLKKQHGICAICDEPETVIVRGKIAPLGVDHNHKTGQIRGLLCSNCNRMIGCAKEDCEILRNGIRYLKSYL